MSELQKEVARYKQDLQACKLAAQEASANIADLQVSYRTQTFTDHATRPAGLGLLKYACLAAGGAVAGTSCPPSGVDLLQLEGRFPRAGRGALTNTECFAS